MRTLRGTRHEFEQRNCHVVCILRHSSLCPSFLSIFSPASIRNACEQALSSYAKQVGLLAITDLIQCILKTSQETPVSKSFCNREFIAPVLSVAISNIHGNPNAANVLDILMALLDTSVYSGTKYYNQVAYQLPVW